MAAIAIKILIVDDYAANRFIYADWLRAIPGVETVEAHGGQQALECIRREDFAMVLVDVNMPDMDGFELVARLRAEPRCASTPIVVVTSHSAERTFMLRGYRTGAIDIIVAAPVHGEILLHKARIFVEIFNQRRELQALVDRERLENRRLQAQLEAFASATPTRPH